MTENTDQMSETYNRMIMERILSKNCTDNYDEIVG